MAMLLSRMALATAATRPRALPRLSLLGARPAHERSCDAGTRPCQRWSSSSSSSSRYNPWPIGRLGSPCPENVSYRPGMFFIHRSLRYQGVILVPFEATAHTYETQEHAEGQVRVQRKGDDAASKGRLLHDSALLSRRMSL